MTRLEKIQQMLEDTGISVYTYSPGDGITRYRFTSEADSDYFGSSTRYRLFTALGIKEAEMYARGARGVIVARSDS